MRDRLSEFLPLVLVGVVLVVFQFSRQGVPTFQFQPPLGPSATPVVEVAGQRAPPPRRLATATPVFALCDPAQPQFAGGLAALKKVLGPTMGEPLECEHAVSAVGDTQQKTTTGLAYYRKQLNAACFTTGWDHWGLVRDGLLQWSGDAIDPPTH
jgi:hypothetical protein